jgi:hypothetical protein
MPKAKAVSGAELAVEKPEWYDLFRVLADTGDKLLEGLLLRKDIPDDVKQTLRAVLGLREAKDLFFTKGKSLTPQFALFSMELLKDFVQSSPEGSTLENIPRY